MGGFLEAPTPYRYRCEACGALPACTEACADAVDALIRREGPDTVAMVIAEPVQAAGGIIVPPPTYLPRLREICRAHDVLLVADEVICGFGRTGRWFGVDNWSVTPDMLTIGKGLTSGYMPLSGVAVGGHIYDVLTTRPDEFTFWQGFTYNAHPGCCAAALQTIEILEKENLVEHAQRMGRRLLDRLRPLETSPIVGEVRGLGLLVGVEIVADRKTRASFPAGRGCAVVRRHCLEHGLIVRAISDTIALSPPLVISESEVDHVADIVSGAVRKAEAELTRS
jgi:putrescine aminotransferase